MRILRTEEDVINRVRTVQKKIRRLMWSLRDIGVVIPGDAVDSAFLNMDMLILDVVQELVYLHFNVNQPALFPQDESTSDDVLSEGGSSLDRRDDY